MVEQVTLPVAVLTGTATHPGRLTCAPFTSTVPPLGTGVTFTVKETAWCASDGLGDADSDVVVSRRDESSSPGAGRRRG